jgi:site-specific recombinase XerD
MREKKTSSSPYLFPSDSKQGHLLEVRKTFASILEEAKITGVRLHDLRRTHASMLINSGASIFDVKTILGHEDIRSTQIYARLATSSLARKDFGAPKS